MVALKSFFTALLILGLSADGLSPLLQRKTFPLSRSSAVQQREGRGQRVVGQVATLPATRKRYALLIGVDSYDDSQITALSGATNDTKTLEDALVRYAGFDPDRVVRLASDQPREFQPTRGNILRFLSNMLRATPEDGLLLLAFSGHGIERNRRAFLLPSDAQVSDDVNLLENTAIEVVRMKEMIRDKRDAGGRITGVSQVIIMLDACRNDPTSGRDVSVNPLTAAYDFNLRNSGVEAFVTLYATSVGNRAYEDSSRKQGYFIAEVVEGLKGAAANEKGEVTLDSLIRHIEDKVPTKVSLRLGREQKPFAVVEGYRASALVVAAATPVAPPVTAPGTPANTSANAPAPATPPTTISNPPATSSLTPVIALPKGVAASALRSAAFTTASVSANGRVTKQTGGPVQYFVEDLGNGVMLEMVAVRGGRFQMGATESGAKSNEKPHPVRVSDYWMGRYEVTQGQWKAVMGELPTGMMALDGKFKGNDLPVVMVSWDEAQEFCRRLSARTGGNYRLPTEAEWEYGARAGTTTPFAFGPTITPEVVNYHGEYPYGNAPKGIYLERPAAVGSLGVGNAFGLYDMHGNVWEWCEDWYGDYPSGEVTDPMGPAGGSARVNRGGGWFNSAVFCRSAFRSYGTPGHRDYSLGFRLVRK